MARTAVSRSSPHSEGTRSADASPGGHSEQRNYRPSFRRGMMLGSLACVPQEAFLSCSFDRAVRRLRD